jgi:hypothetical protein
MLVLSLAAFRNDTGREDFPRSNSFMSWLPQGLRHQSMSTYYCRYRFAMMGR